MSRRFSPEELASCRCKPEQIAGLAFAADCPLHGSARYEDIAPRLAGEATEQVGGTARWNAGKERSDGTAQVYAPSYGPLRRVVPIAETSAVCAALIAYHHPARVVALAAVVARLRERAAEGHARECMRRFRPETMACKCGHEADVEALRRLDEEA